MPSARSLPLEPGPAGLDDVFQADASPGLPLDVIARARALRARLDALMNAPLPPAKALPELTTRTLERLEAFALRDAVKDPR